MDKMRLLLFTLSMIMLISFKAGAHNPDSLNFKQHGNPILRVFSNFNTSISEGIDDGGFEIRRAYLGYEYFLSPDFEIAIKLDIGSPNDASEYSLLRRFAYFKNAYVRYNWKKLSTQFGIVDVYQFKLQEKYWAHRYIWESFMDEFDFGPSADLGWNITYKFADFVSADFGLYNGEGYSKLQNDNAFKAGLGVSLLPVKGLLVRIYGDAIKKTNYQTTLAGFVGYTYENKFIGGVEYNYQFNNRYLEGQDKYGFSFYASYYITSKWQLFTRYDQVYSNVLPDNENPWDLEEDGSAVVGGVEFSPIRQIKIALNYQDWTPYAKNLISQSYLYLNFEYKL